MSLNKLRSILENTQIIQNEETYKQFAGLKYDNTVIKEISKLKFTGCELFLGSFSEPRELFLSSLENMAEDKT